MSSAELPDKPYRKELLLSTNPSFINMNTNNASGVTLIRILDLNIPGRLLIPLSAAAGIIGFVNYRQLRSCLIKDN